MGPTSAVLFNLARSELELNRARGRELLREFIAVGEDSPWHDEAVGLLGDTLSPSATATPLAPTVAGVGLGSAALQVSGRLGIPSSRERKGEYMVWRYDDQGLAFFFTASDEVALFMVFAGTDYTIEGVAPGQAVTSIYATLGMPHERSEGAVYYVRSGWYLIIQTRKGMVTAVAATAKDGT